MNRLAIIIPHYKEKEDIIEFNLSMIKHQLGIDFERLEVIIVNDGPNAYEFPKSFLDSFKPLKIKQLRTPENHGPAGARNYGVKHTSAKYVMFSDCDDGFASVAALFNFFQIIDKNKADIYSSRFLNEQMTDNGIILKEQNNRSTWVHAKILKRQTILKYELFFDESIRYNEDVYFNLLICTDKITKMFIPYDSYVTRLANTESMCKVVPDDVMTVSYIDAVSKALNHMKSRPDLYTDDDVKESFYRTLTFMSTFNYSGIYADPDMPNKVDKLIGKYFAENFEIFQQISDEYKNKEYARIMKNTIDSAYYSKENIEKLSDTTYIDLEKYIKDCVNKLINEDKD